MNLDDYRDTPCGCTDQEISDYERFQNWLNDCPVEIINYLDYTNKFEVTFKVPLEDVLE